ncbi:MAG: hypothetical protein ABSG53_00860 [Thermoguttaceae bacterium]|jgi:hypothetical protein
MTSATDYLLSLPPYGLTPEVKTTALLAAVREQITHHDEHCPPYARWLRHQGFNPQNPIQSLADVPWLPVSIFKRLFLSSVPESQVVRVLASSGTSAQVPSRLPLDQTTRNRQMKALAAILSHRLGSQRRPFLILDAPQEKSMHADGELSARVAGMRGYLMAATEQEYALRRDGDRLLLDREKVVAAVRRWAAEGKPFCLLGYTYVLYEYVVRPLRAQGIHIELPPSTFVVHFGGWKKLQQQTVTKPVLTDHAAEVFGLATGSIVDIYGFTEQLGVIYPDDSQGIKRTPTYAEVLVRDPRTLEIVPDGTVGLLEFVCPLPHSYPGVAVLLDDMGRIIPRYTGSDGGRETAFEIVGRAQRAETRGCGDTLPRQIYENAGPTR